VVTGAFDSICGEWPMLSFAQTIEALWALRMGENQDRVQQLAAHVMQRDAERSPPSATGARVGELVSEIKRGTTFNVSSRTTPE
jgi:hypothetical protein